MVDLENNGQDLENNKLPSIQDRPHFAVITLFCSHLASTYIAPYTKQQSKAI